ncbi:fimbrial protein [Klebsiella michiganensis]
MRNGKMLAFLAIAIFFNSVLWSQAARASCSFKEGTQPAQVTFTIPPLVVNADKQPGTILYTEQQTSNTVNVSCNAYGTIYQGYTALSDSDLVTGITLDKVYATNIPGIGVRAGWGNKTSTPLNSPITPWHLGSSTVNKSDGTYNIVITAAIQIVVTGPVSSGILDTNKLVVDWKYDDLIVGQIRFNSTSVNVQANTCNLVEKNIVVPLDNIVTSEFRESNVSRVVSDDSFKIQLQGCAKDIEVDYKFTSVGSTGVSGASTILDIATGNGAAEGVGIQLLDFSGNILQFDKEYLAVANTTENQSITIPLKARYIKTGTLKAGEVNAVANFEIYYR